MTCKLGGKKHVQLALDESYEIYMNIINMFLCGFVLVFTS